MQHLHSLEEVSLQSSWLTIGVFDGVHLGHQEIIRRLVRQAHTHRGVSVVLTFDPHPASVLGNHSIQCLNTVDERAQALGDLGVDFVITQHFTRDLSAVSAQDYMSSLKKALGLRHLLIGYDFALGKGREGNASRLTELGHEMGYTVEVISAVSDESGVISSTEIRKLVRTGNMAEVAKLLGRRYAVQGPVIHGDGRGKQINFPTANIDYPENKALPANGIYACWATLGGDRLMAATNIGYNPTFTPERQTRSVEAYLLGLQHDIYGEQLKLEFVSRLRDEQKFNSVEALVERIQADVDQTRKILSGDSPPPNP